MSKIFFAFFICVVIRITGPLLKGFLLCKNILSWQMRKLGCNDFEPCPEVCEKRILCFE